jgi:hypothetical protein
VARVLAILTTGTGVLIASLASAQITGGPDQALREWELLPEKPAMREVCARTLEYATKIAVLKNGGVAPIAAIRWATKESERVAAALPNDPLLPIGTQLNLISLIRNAYLAEPIYQQIAGGFPQWAYRSCLKSRPIQ